MVAAKFTTHGAGGVVINSSGMVLVVRQKNNTWSLPKGHVEQGEDALMAARREIYEESGISQLRYIAELGTYERDKIHKNGTVEHKIITIFLFTTSEVALQPLDPKNPGACWVEKEAAAKLLSYPEDKEFFTRHMARFANLK